MKKLLPVQRISQVQIAKRIKRLKAKAWKTISELVRRRDKRCVACGVIKPFEELDCSHYIPNTERSASLGGNELWYSLVNLNATCRKCNRFAAGNLTQYAEFLEKKYGAGILQKLRILYNKYKKLTEQDLTDLIEYWKKEIKRLS